MAIERSLAQGMSARKRTRVSHYRAGMDDVVVELADADGTIHRLGIDRSGRWTAPHPQWPLIEVGVGVALPGLVDGHAHLSAADPGHMDGSHDDGMDLRIRRHADDQLRAGVLVVVDKGTHNVDTVDITVAVREAERPAVQLAGRFLATDGGYYQGYAIDVGTGGMAAAVAAASPPAASWVKLIGDWPRRGLGAVPNFDEAELRSAVSAAHAAGRRAAIHTAAPETPSMAVRAGVDSIEHGLFMTEDDLAQLGDRRGAWVPTVGAMEMLVEQLGRSSSGGQLLQQGLDNVRRLLPHACTAGVTVMAGTDLAYAHGEVATEATRLLAYGMREGDVLDALSTGSRAYLDLPGFASGEPADFVIVDDASVAALAAPRLVVRCGTVVVDRRR